MAGLSCNLFSQPVPGTPQPDDPQPQPTIEELENLEALEALEDLLDPSETEQLPDQEQIQPAPAAQPPTTNQLPVAAPPPFTLPRPTAQPPSFPTIPRSEPARRPATVAPTSSTPTSPPVILNFRNAPLEQIFDFYSQLTGRVVLYPTQLQTQAITVTTSPEIHLSPEEGVLAIEGALALNGVTLIPMGDRFIKAVPVAQSIMEGSPINQLDADDLPDAEQFITQVVQLKVATPSEIATVFASFSKTPGGIVPIDSSMIIVLRDYASNIKRMLELIKRIDVQPESNYVLEVLPIKYGKVADFFQTMNALVSGSAAGAGLTAPRTTTPPTGSRSLGTSSRGLGTSGTGTSRYGSQTQTGLQRSIGTVQPQQVATTPGAQGSTFQQRLQQIVNRAAGPDEIELLSDARIVPDERSNSLIVYANRQDMRMITNIVSKVDVLLAQVLIEGIVMAVVLSDEQQLGVSWLQHPRQFGSDSAGAGVINNGLPFLSGLTNFPGSQPSGFSYFGKLNEDFEVSVRAFARDGNVRILQRPRVQTSHAVPGYFFSGSTVPYVTGFYDYGGIGGSFGSRSQVQQVEVGVRLEVVPYITPDGLVVLDIFQDISQLGEFVRIDNNDVPTTTSRNAQATLSVRDGETIILGGYIEDSRSSGKSGVPVLKDIPLLGALFRSKSRNNSRTELILLMHVSILKNPDDAGRQTATEKARLPGISAAEKEFLEEEFKRQSN
jgi:general secretion pathway protein D